MAKKIFTYRGLKIDELKQLSIEEFAKLLPSSERRKIVTKGFTDQEKKFLSEIEKGNNVKTHCRDMVILPLMVGKTVKIHNGKEFVDLAVVEQMVGHRLGEFALTRRNVKHGAVGVASAIKH